MPTACSAAGTSFPAPEHIDVDVTAALRALFSGMPAFDFQLPQTGWLGQQVLWLAPEPAAPFRRLTEGCRNGVPRLPPYAASSPISCRT